MASSSLGALLYGPQDLRVEDMALGPPGEGEVQIEIKQTGLCGSDLHYYLHGRNGDFALRAPMCLGHESAGIVVALGAGAHEASGLQLGARVAIEAGRYCANCDRCREGRYNLCPDMRFASSAKTFPHLHGTLQQRMDWPAGLVHPLPPHLSLTVGALIEPLSVVLQALTRTRFGPGESLLVIGAGAIGQLACAAARASGASFVGAVDIDASRVHFATDNAWADYAITVPLQSDKSSSGTEQLRSRAEEDRAAMELVKQQAADVQRSFPFVASSGGFDVVLECTGVPSCVALGIFAARAGGRVGLVGMGHPVQTLPMGAAALREVDLIGVFRYAGMYPKAIEMLASGALRASGAGRQHTAGPPPGAPRWQRKGEPGGIENLVSHRFRLADARAAFEVLRAGRSEDGRGVVKVFISEE